MYTHMYTYMYTHMYTHMYTYMYTYTYTYTDTKNTDWLCYDDDRVFRCSKDKVVSEYAYILFYCRRDCR